MIRRNHLGLVHPAILPYLPTPLLRSTHLVVCALRGRCWGSQEPKLRFVSMHSWSKLHAYHLQVLREMAVRGFRTAPRWKFPGYRGRKVPPWPQETQEQAQAPQGELGYPEHTPDAYRACLDLLRRKVLGANWSIPDRHRLELAPDYWTLQSPPAKINAENS
jgi:uncharacterized protein (TIGR02328 family)